ncbi:primosomal protein N' [Verrucomicrobiota bacterium]
MNPMPDEEMMPSIAKIVVDIALNRKFDYLVPAGLRESASIGSRVVVPFGKSQATGYIVDFLDNSDRKDLKEIISLTGNKSLIDEKMLSLTRWVSEYYYSTFEQAIRTALPGPVRRKGAGDRKRNYVSFPEVRSQKSRRRQGYAGQDGGQAGVRSEEREVKDKRELPPKQKAVMEILQVNDGMFLNELIRKLNITAAPVKALEKKGLVEIESVSQRRDPLANKKMLRTEPLNLMPEQAEALERIKTSLDARVSGFRFQVSGEASNVEHPTSNIQYPTERGRDGVCAERTPSTINHQPLTILLYGVTGSGKTEVYLQAIDYALRKKMGAIVLVPEISLTPQTVERFAGRFGNCIAVLHSHLSAGERHDEWHRIHNGEASIVIGARSAVFAPVKNLGLIVVDEEHEPSYKQEEAPRYNARDVAVMRGRMENCAVVLGSATPSMESWFNARKGKYQLAELPNRADNRKMPVVRIIDMRIETERTGHVSVFSRELLDAIRARLDRAEQTILFLNRRGFSTSLICPKCGYVAKCDNCSVSYTYHRVTRLTLLRGQPFPQPGQAVEMYVHLP